MDLDEERSAGHRRLHLEHDRRARDVVDRAIGPSQSPATAHPAGAARERTTAPPRHPRGRMRYRPDAISSRVPASARGRLGRRRATIKPHSEHAARMSAATTSKSPLRCGLRQATSRNRRVSPWSTRSLGDQDAGSRHWRCLGRRPSGSGGGGDPPSRSRRTASARRLGRVELPRLELRSVPSTSPRAPHAGPRSSRFTLLPPRRSAARVPRARHQTGRRSCRPVGWDCGSGEHERGSDEVPTAPRGAGAPSVCDGWASRPCQTRIGAAEGQRHLARE